MNELGGKRIVVTRAVHQAEELAAPLRKLGAEILLVPVVGIQPPVDPEPLHRAAQRVHEYDWIVFTSANAVAAFAANLATSNASAAPPVAAVGRATREAARAQGFHVALTPEEYVAESLIEAFAGHDLAGCRILIPSAAVTRDVVPAGLRRQGAQVDVVEAYRNAIPSEAAEQAHAVFQEPYPDWVTFASSSAVDHLLQLIGREPLAGMQIASIGPVTSGTIRRNGLMVAAEASEYTVDGLVAAIRTAVLRAD